jgi:hypothetical protein
MCGNCDGGDELCNSMAAVSVVACCLGVASGCRGASWFMVLAQAKGFGVRVRGFRGYVQIRTLESVC